MGKAALLPLACACGHLDFAHNGSAGDGNGDALPMRSCAGLTSTCGPASASCCADSVIPGGTFYRSYDVAGDNMFMYMTNPATLSDFRLDTYEVTVARFRQFVNAGMGTQARPPTAGAGAHPQQAASGWSALWNTSLVPDTASLVAGLNCNAAYQAWTDVPGANETLPINCITWYEAFAFCAWDGGFLPSEAEWNYAAAGGNGQRAYPWSIPASQLAIDCTYANYNFGLFYCVGAVDHVGSESPLGDGRWGQADLGGNVDEWVVDAYYNYQNPCIDCIDLTSATFGRTIRGGSFTATSLSLRAGRRSGVLADFRSHDHGVRCARAP